LQNKNNIDNSLTNPPYQISKGIFIEISKSNIATEDKKQRGLDFFVNILLSHSISIDFLYNI
jgi:hypothetical protein